MESRTKSLSKKKLMTSPNIDTSLSKKRDCSIKFCPEVLEFANIEYNQRYEMQLQIKNEGIQSEKIRIIPPNSDYFSVKLEANPVSLAPGLCTKVAVHFIAFSAGQIYQKSFEDSIIIIGEKFMSKVLIKASRPSSELIVPKIFKLGFIKLGRQCKFQIPIQNMGKQDVQLCMIKSSTPAITIENSKIFIKKEEKQFLNIKICISTPGVVSERLFFPGKSAIQLKGICSEESFQIYSKDGEVLKAKNFGPVLIGEKISFKFYLMNNSSLKIEGIAKVFGKNFIEYGNLKVDYNKMTFVNRSNPKKAIQQQNFVNFKCTINKFSIQPFSDLQNALNFEKTPTHQEQRTFQKQAFDKMEIGSRESGWNTLTEINEVLYIKLLNTQQPIRIPIQYSPIIPKIHVSNDKFQFTDIALKQAAEKQFQIHNFNQKQITVNFQNQGFFKIIGDQIIKPWEKKKYIVIFRPILPGQFYESLKISVLNCWKILIKVFGSCSPKLTLENKQNIKIKIRKNMSAEFNKTSRYLFQERKKRLDAEKIHELKNKLTERVNLGFCKNPDQPIDLIFDAGQNPKVPIKKRINLELQNSCLFFNADQYARSLLQKKRTQAVPCTRLNMKQIVKFSQLLTKQELSKIQLKCDRLDFGNIFVGSVSQKQLIIQNKNSKPILVEIQLGKSQIFFETKAEMKKIQAHGQGRFPIKIKSQNLGSLRAPISYIINKQHIFEIDAVANVTLVNLGFSTNHLQFNFTPNDSSLEKSQQLTVTNLGNTLTKFTVIEPSNKVFSVEEEGEQEVQGNSSTTITVKYHPLQGGQSGESRVDTGKIIIKVIGGAENVIKCEGTVLEPKYSVKQNQFNFNEAFISMPYSSKLTFRNNLKFETAIKIELSPPFLSEVVSLDQRNFILSCDEKKQIGFTIISHQTKSIKGAFIINSRGGKVLKVPLNINFCMPVIEVLGLSQIDLGTIHIMTSHCEREVTLINKMKSEIKLEATEDIQNDYTLQFTAAHQKVELAMRNTYQDSQKDEAQRKSFPKKSIVINAQATSLSTAKKIKNSKSITKIMTLSPGIQTKFKLKFVPKIVKTYQIKIPLYLHGAMRDIEPIAQKIKCKAVQPLFYMSPYRFSFHNIIISENEHIQKRQFEIINPHNREVDWQIVECNEQINKLFKFDQVKGKLKARQSRKNSFYFHPLKQGVFNYKIEFISNIDPTIKVEIEVTGIAVAPRIGFSKNILVLPVVPIKTQSKGIIQIQNFGYETVTISKAKFTNNFQMIDLKFVFLDGKLLSLAKKRIKIQISFKSDIPISITTGLEIFDQYGDKLVIPISATADSCILTTYSYLQTNNSSIVYDNSDNSLKLQVSKAFNNKNKQTNMSGSTSVTSSFIKKWCSYELNIHISKFPEAFIQSKGELLYELIIKMVNGRPIIKKPCFVAQEKLASILELHTYYSDVIKALQMQGAFLNHIRPEHLLNVNDYLVYMFEQQKIIEQQEHEYLSFDSWTILFYQLCKLYVEPIINDKFIQKFNYKSKQQKLFTSNLYSDNQLKIIGFINQFLGSDRLYSFNDQPKIYQSIQRIMQKTFKVSLNEQLTKLKINTDALMLHEFLIIVSKFLFNHLQEFGLSMYLQPNDLFTMGHKQFVLFFISLMQNLINFQTYSIIQFESSLGEKQQKVIELQNPSKKNRIMYRAKMFGSQNFKIVKNQIQIQPQGTRTIKIGYQCKKNISQEAQLILVPVKDQNCFSYGQCINFLLKNVLISKTVVKKTHVKSHIYDIKTISLDIQLPFVAQSSEYNFNLVDTSPLDNEYPSYYLMQPGPRTIKNGKDRLEVKVAPLHLEDFSFKVVVVSSSLQQYIYEFIVHVILPNPSLAFNIDPMTVDKQEFRSIKIPIENDLKDQCIRFHREMIKERDKRKKTDSSVVTTKTRNKVNKIKFLSEMAQDSLLKLCSDWVQVGFKQKNERNQQLNKVQLKAEFGMPYRQYKSQIVLKNEENSDYRVYIVATSVSIKPKNYSIKMVGKARDTVRTFIPIKVPSFIHRFQRPFPQLQVQVTESGDLFAIFKPTWIIKEQVDLIVQNTETFEQHICKIKLQSKLPDPVKVIKIQASSLFETPFEIDVTNLKFNEKEFATLKVLSEIYRKSEVRLEQTNGVRKLMGVIYPSQNEQISSIKLKLPKSDQFYQYVVEIKNSKVIDLGSLTLMQNIGEQKKYIIKQVLGNKPTDFYIESQSIASLIFDYVPVEVTDLKNSKKIGERKFNLCIVFKPNKQIKCESSLKIRADSKQYAIKLHFSVKKYDEISIPLIVCENLDKKSTVIFIENLVQVQGAYTVQMNDPKSFTFSLQRFQLKLKQKISLSVCFEPRYIGESIKKKLILKSQNLPELTYNIEAVSKFKCKQVYEQIEGYEGILASKELDFVNQFADKDRFRFQIFAPYHDYCFDFQSPTFVKDIEPGEGINFLVKNKTPVYREDIEKQTKVTVTKLSTRKIVKQYILSLSVVKNLQVKKYVWQCKARQTLFETIKLPECYTLKQISTDPDIEKYLSFNIEEKNGSQAKLKFSPLKPIKSKNISILLITNQIKFRILCHVKVSPPSPDDTIIIKTSQIKQIGVVIFRLTNVVREPASFRAYFQQNHQQLEVQPSHGILEPYGKTGTPIKVKFKSEVHNKRVDDRLMVETDSMFWIFKVVGVQQKTLSF